MHMEHIFNTTTLPVSTLYTSTQTVPDVGPDLAKVELGPVEAVVGHVKVDAAGLASVPCGAAAGVDEHHRGLDKVGLAHVGFLGCAKSVCKCCQS